MSHICDIGYAEETAGMQSLPRNRAASPVYQTNNPALVAGLTLGSTKYDPLRF
jgi:hypothetical protein